MNGERRRGSAVNADRVQFLGCYPCSIRPSQHQSRNPALHHVTQPPPVHFQWAAVWLLSVHIG
eukprot:5503160-Pyramimonas_sp.AAC.1